MLRELQARARRALALRLCPALAEEIRLDREACLRHGQELARSRDEQVAAARARTALVEADAAQLRTVVTEEREKLAKAEARVAALADAEAKALAEVEDRRRREAELRDLQTSWISKYKAALRALASRNLVTYRGGAKHCHFCDAPMIGSDQEPRCNGTCVRVQALRLSEGECPGVTAQHPTGVACELWRGHLNLHRCDDRMWSGSCG